jgi:predicted AAA+ superfamily ATPase
LRNGIAGILAHLSEGALFENAVHNQLRGYGELSYLAKGSEHEIDFIVKQENSRELALEVKYHPILSDDQKLKRLAAKFGISESWLVGKYPAPGFQDFLWSGSIF